MSLETDLQEGIRQHAASRELWQQQSTLHEQKRIELEQKVNIAISDLSTVHAITDYLMTFKDAPITLQPRLTDKAQADAFNFATASDYAPEGCYVDLSTTLPGETNWWSDPAPIKSLNKVSIYLCAAIGNVPHPIPKSETRIAILYNLLGAYHHWILTPNSVPNYGEPRVLFDKTRNMKLLGQSNGITNYDDWFEIARNQPNPTGFGLSHIRIINIGVSPIHIKAFIIQRFAGA